MQIKHSWLTRTALGNAVATIVALSTVLVAAGASSAATARASTTLAIWYGTDDPTEGPLAQSLAAHFERSQSGTHVSMSVYGLDDINTKLQLAMAAGSPPDLVYTTPRGPGLPSYVRAGRLLDLTAVARKDRWVAKLPAGVLASYNDGIVPSGRAGGKVYAAPSVIAAVAILYNQRLFQQLHLSIPRSIAEFEAICAKVKAAGLVPIGFGNADGWVGDDWYLTLVNALTGPAALVPELHLDPHFSFEGAAFQTAASTLLMWNDKGFFTPQFGGLDAQDSVEAFFDGHTAMQLVSSTQNGQISALAAESKTPIGIFAYPSADRNRAPIAPQSGYAGWAVPRGSHHPALAEGFITSVLSDPAAETLGAHGLLPAHSLSSTQIAALPPFVRAYLAALRNAAPGIYLDGAPVPNLNATMEANVQLLLQHFEAPNFLPHSLQVVYDSHGVKASATRIDGEF
jgi:raffinose/stachyose/melibiose transport system substrate-binding protein